MSDFFKFLTLCAVMALAAPAAAQTTTETPAETTTEADAPADGDTPRTDGLSTGQEVAGQGEPYVRSEHGDWDLRCIRVPEGQQEPCQLYQLLEDQNGNSVAEINLFNLPADDQLAAGATIVTPLETLLTQQVQVSVDGGQAKVYPFTFCAQIGCFSRVGFTNGDIASFKRGNEAKIVVVPAQAPDQKVELTVSLTGFTAGFEAVTIATKPAE